MVDANYPVSQEQFPAAPTIHASRFGLLGAFGVRDRDFDRWRGGASSRIHWSNNAVPRDEPLQEFQIVQKFLLEKQLFFGRDRPFPSFPPERGITIDRLAFKLRLATRTVDLNFHLLSSYYREQKILMVLLFGELPDLSLDELIFLKQTKWYKETGERSCLSLADHPERRFASLHETIVTALEDLGLSAIDKNEWPFFDLIELHDFGPSGETGPNSENRLTSQQHFGLLTGDEGYRLIDPKEKNVCDFLAAEDMRFAGRKYFLYHFHVTSCVAFLDARIYDWRGDWRRYYKDHVGYIKLLDNYIGFRNTIPCLADGIVLLVEVCLLRYVELCRIDQLLERSRRRLSVQQIWRRLWGHTILENTIRGLERLDLYTGSALWIIGGPYSERLFAYSDLRSRIDRAIDRSQIIRSEIISSRLTTLSLVIAILAIALSFVTNVMRSSDGLPPIGDPGVMRESGASLGPLD